MHEYCGRPIGYEDKILRALSNVVKPGDVLIHLGDICWHDDEKWHELLKEHAPCKRWLVLGNHDHKSTNWYLDHGWDFVGRTFTLEKYGATILFSHVPQVDTGYTWNIHGHFHNTDHRSHEPELVAIKNDKQILVAVEYLHYQPIELGTLLERTQKSRLSDRL
jgi:calcineurin-like phosphoesterase family protein